MINVSFKIGNVQIKNNVVLAPIAGISNPSYIKICDEMGVGLAFTELISAEAIESKKLIFLLQYKFFGQIKILWQRLLKF